MRCELDVEAMRRGSAPTDRLTTTPKSDGRAVTQAFGWINIVLGLGAAIATPIAISAADDDSMTDLARAASYVSGIGSGVALIVTGSYLVSVSIEQPVYGVVPGSRPEAETFSAGVVGLRVAF